ncbi:hypothetical protein ACI51Z_09230 [Pectobacterium carotovorum]|uniref:hypothetical protein n=1 Tax=Pectobacterium carotovorum TaxID=554 RepID=UPI00386AA102
MNNMNTLTNSQIKCMAEGSKQYTHDDVTVIASRLLAAEAQLAELRGQGGIVAWMHRQLPIAKSNEDKEKLTEIVAARYDIPLYARPVPPVASQPVPSTEFRYYIDDQIKFYSHMCDRDDAVGTADALTMSQHRLRFYQQAKTLFSASQPYTVPDDWTYNDAVNFIQINGMGSEDRAGVAMRAHNNCRAAMLQSRSKS